MRLPARPVLGALAAGLLLYVAPWRSSGEFEWARRSGRAGALALSLALGRRLFEQYPKFKQYDSSETSGCSQAVYIAMNGMAKNILHVPVWRPEQCVVPRHSSQLSRDIVHTCIVEVCDVAGKAGGDRCRRRGAQQSEVAREYGVSRRWVQKLMTRYDGDGEAGLAPRSRRPRTSPQRTPPELEEEIVALRKTLAEEGLDAGAATIAFHLAARHGTAPAVSTIWRVLSRRGFVTPQPGKRPRSSYIRFQAGQPSERWQLDTTRWQLGDGSPAEILNIIDDHSRLLTASQARLTFKAADVVTVFRQAASQHGLPASMLSDNGAVFTGKPRGGGKVALEIELAALHISFRHSRACHPQTCGKAGRFHQTLKKWLARQPAAATLAELQAQLDWFTCYYNTIRPHRALGRRTPATAFAARPPAGPGGLTAAAHYRIRHDRVDDSGVITIRCNSRLHHIGIGRAHAGSHVLALIADLDIKIIHRDTGELPRALTLNPATDYQPQARKRNNVSGHL